MSNQTKILAGCLVLSVVFNLVSFRDGHEWGDDFALYISQAKSIVTHSIPALQRQQELLRTRSRSQIGPPIYPWGFPLILVPVYALFGLNLYAMKLTVYAFFILSLWMVYLLLRDRLNQTQLMFILLSLSLSPAFFTFKENILSDVPFLFFCLLSIYLIQRCIIEKRGLVHPAVDYGILGLALFSTYFIRAQAVFLFPVLFVSQGIPLRKEFRDHHTSKIREMVFHTIPYLVSAGCMLAGNILLPSSSYIGYVQSTNLLTSIIQNIGYYFWLPAEFFYPPVLASVFPFGALCARIVFVITVPVVMIGIGRLWRSDYLYVLVLVSVATVLLPWPFPQGLRFIFPCIPFYLYFLLAGLSKIPRPLRLKQTLRLEISSVFFVLMLCCFFIMDSGIVVKTFTGMKMINGPFTQESMDLISSIDRSTGTADTLIFFKPRALYLLAQRPCFSILDTALLRTQTGDYLVMDDHSRDIGQPPLQYGIGKIDTSFYHMIFRNRRFSMYRLGAKE